MRFLNKLFNTAQSLQAVSDEYLLPSVEIEIIGKHTVIDYSLFKSTRGYLEKIVTQINATYENTCYDACSVMIRRLIEIQIIESFENTQIEYKIKEGDGNYCPLSELINKFLTEPSFHLSRTTKRSLKDIKNIGDLSAHSRRYNTNRNDIDKLLPDLRVTIEELLYLSGLKT
jgi:hypothetical protein